MKAVSWGDIVGEGIEREKGIQGGWVRRKKEGQDHLLEVGRLFQEVRQGAVRNQEKVGDRGGTKERITWKTRGRSGVGSRIRRKGKQLYPSGIQSKKGRSILY